MDPNSQLSQNNPYEFIMNPQTPVSRNPFGGSFMLKLVLIIGVGGFIALGLYIFALTTGTSSTSNEVLLGIAQQQYELKRVSNAGTTTARRQIVKNFGANTSMTITSHQFDLLTFLAKRGYKVQNKQLTLKFNPVTDKNLAAARDASEFDEAYVNEMVTELKSYQASLKSAYDKTQVKKEKDLLSGLYAQAQLLIQQSTIKQ